MQDQQLRDPGPIDALPVDDDGDDDSESDIEY
jgi:hypothetical protein